MLKVTVTNLRKNFFNYLDKVSNGEIIYIYRHKKNVAKLLPPNIKDWRDQMKNKVEILVEPDELIAPIEDIWQEYV
ncbi:type II toxin-antitoxin system Phd/YefM family antitoxin [candidate division KSB1 bacterium]|nr:type II toxin-antitoxin system Phd/YefM family antitoxin [candidate division KSB1 bacterium]